MGPPPQGRRAGAKSMPVAMMHDVVVMVVRTGRGGAGGREDAKSDGGGEDALHRAFSGSNQARQSQPDNRLFNPRNMSGR